MDHLKISPVAKSQLSDVYDLVCQLAAYENSENQVECRLEDFIKLYEDQLYGVLGAFFNGHLCGVTIYYYIFSTWKGKVLYLEDFIVDQPYRNQGIGKQLFEALVHEAQKSNCKYMRWQVLDWNDPAIAFYKKYATIFDGGWQNCQLRLSPLDA